MSTAQSWSAAENDAASAASTALLQDLEKQYVQVKLERDALQQQLVSQNELLVTQTALQEQLTLAKAGEQNTRAVLEEKKAVEERLDRVQAEGDRLRAEISHLTETNAKLQQQVDQMQVASQLQESQAIPLFHEKQRLQTELDAITTHAAWLEQELNSQAQALTKTRQEARDHALQLQLQLDQTFNDKEAAETQLSVLQTMEQQLQDKVQLLTRSLRDKTEEFVSLQETTQIELAQERKLIQQQQDHLTQWQQRYRDLEREHEALRVSAADALEESKREMQEQARELETKYQQLLHEAAAAVKPVPPVVAAAPVVPLRLTAGSPPAGEPNEQDGPISLTELYTRLEETKRDLRREQQARQRAETNWNLLQRDIQETAPRLMQQRAEYEMALQQVEDYQKRLETIVIERDDARLDVKEARLEADRMKRRLHSKELEVKELASQVQALLIKSQGGTVASKDYPTSVAEMQSQNQRLTVEVRRLTEEKAQLEVRLQSDTLRLKVDSLRGEVHKLREERKKQEIEVERIVQQRDLYRALLQKHDSNILGSENEELSALEIAKDQSARAKKLEQLNRELEGDLASARNEIRNLTRLKEEMTERLARYEAHTSGLTATIDQLERDLLSAKSEVARDKANADYHKEKCAQLEASLHRAREEISQVGHAKSQLQRINSELHQSLSKASDEKTRFETEKQRVEMKLRLAETQVEMARAAEKRLLEENRQLREESARQGTTISSVRKIEAMLAAKSDEETSSLQAECERLKQQIDRDQTKHSVEIDNMLGRVHELEARVQDLDSSKQQALADALRSKQALLEGKAEAQKFATRVSELEVQLRTAKRKLGEADDDEDIESSLRTRIQTLSSELEAAKAEVVSWQERAAGYQKIAEESETLLADFKATTEEKLSSQSKEIEKLNLQISSLKEEAAKRHEIIEELTTSLAGQREERESLAAELHGQIQRLETQIATDASETEASKASVAAMKMDMEALRSEVERARDNYERELALHAQARSALRQAREQVDEESRLRHNYQEQLEEAKATLDKQHELWEQEKSTIQDALQLTEKSLAEVREQNTVLHEQIETLGQLVTKSQSARAESAAADADPSSVSSDHEKIVAELRDVVKFLRSESELLQAQLDNAKRAAERERAAGSVMRRSLDEARAELKSLQSQLVAESGNQDEVDTLKATVQSLEDQVNLLKDSNKLLREDASHLQTSLTAAQEKIDEARKTAEPVEAIKQELQVRIASLESEKESLSRELNDWKNRVKSLVSKFNQIDPEEHKQLQLKLEEMRKEAESLNKAKTGMEEGNARLRAIARNLQEKNRDLSQQIEKLTAENDKVSKASSANQQAAAERDELKEQLDELKKKVTLLEKDVTSKDAELQGAISQSDRLRIILRKLQSEIQALKEKEKITAAEVASLKAQVAASNASPELTRADLEVQGEAPTATTAETDNVGQNGPELESRRVYAVPEGGFKFGPSQKPKIASTGATEASTRPVTRKRESAPVDVKASSEIAERLQKRVKSSIEGKPDTDTEKLKPSLRAQAAIFVPPQPSRLAATGASQKSDGKPTADGSQPVAAVKSGTKTEVVSKTVTETAPAIRRMSGEKKELSIKEKLLEKKRRLAEKILAANKKAEEATQPPQEVSSEGKVVEPATSTEPTTITDLRDVPESKDPFAENEPPTSEPAKPETMEVAEPETTEEADVAPHKPDTLPLPASDETKINVQEAVAATVPLPAAPVSDMPLDMVDQSEAVEETLHLEGTALEAEHLEEEDEDEMPAEHIEEEDKEAMDDDEKPELPFGSSISIMSTPFGSGIAAPTPSGSFFARTTAVAPSDSAFLDLKPPGSSTTPPLFSFGSGSAITLPIPSLPTATAMSPFAASVFPGGAFGSLGSVSAVPQRSLFPALGKLEEEKMDDENAAAVDEMVDDDDEEEQGDMEAE